MEKSYYFTELPDKLKEKLIEEARDEYLYGDEKVQLVADLERVQRQRDLKFLGCINLEHLVQNKVERPFGMRLPDSIILNTEKDKTKRTRYKLLENLKNMSYGTIRFECKINGAKADVWPEIRILNDQYACDFLKEHYIDDAFSDIVSMIELRTTFDTENHIYDLYEKEIRLALEKFIELELNSHLRNYINDYLQLCKEKMMAFLREVPSIEEIRRTFENDKETKYTIEKDDTVRLMNGSDIPNKK